MPIEKPAIGSTGWGDEVWAVIDRVNELAGIEATITAKEDAGTAAGAIATHEAASNPHPGYLTQAEGDAAYQPLDTDLSTIAGLAASDGQLIKRVAGAWAASAITKSDVGLTNVDNTSDDNKPISTATQTALNAKLPTADAPELIRDTMGTALVAGTNVTITPNDGSDTITIASSTSVKPHPPVTLTDATTVATDASLGTHFRLSMGGNRTLGPPTNPTDGQVAVWEVTASAAARTLSLDTGTGGFAYGTDITALTATSSGLTDYVQAVYRTSVNKWRVIAYVKGY
jgi:predicted secreted protein